VKECNIDHSLLVRPSIITHIHLFCFSHAHNLSSVSSTLIHSGFLPHLTLTHITRRVEVEITLRGCGCDEIKSAAVFVHR